MLSACQGSRRKRALSEPSSCSRHVLLRSRAIDFVALELRATCFAGQTVVPDFGSMEGLISYLRISVTVDTSHQLPIQCTHDSTPSSCTSADPSSCRGCSGSNPAGQRRTCRHLFLIFTAPSGMPRLQTVAGANVPLTYRFGDAPYRTYDGPGGLVLGVWSGLSDGVVEGKVDDLAEEWESLAESSYSEVPLDRRFLTRMRIQPATRRPRMMRGP